MSVTEDGQDLSDRLEDLSRDDRFRVDTHDRPLRVHRDAEFVGNVVLVAYDDTGAQWPVVHEDGEFYIGQMDSRRKQFESIEVLDE